VHACPFGVPKIDQEEKLQYKCNLCYDRTSVGLAPMCASVCPTGSIFYGTLEELLAARPGAAATDIVVFGEQEIVTGVVTVVPAGSPTSPVPGGMS
jgi:Fe-S-cluster-containing dehydrogenase component